MLSEVSDSFSDSEVTKADNNFTSTKQKVIRTRGGLRRAARRDPRTRGSHAHQAVGPQATTDIPSWFDTVRAKRRFNFQGIPDAHAEPYDPSSPLAFLKTFITDELVDNVVNFTNKCADIIINDPAIQARIAGKHRSVFHLWKNSNKDETCLYFGVCLIMVGVQNPEYHMYWTRRHTFTTPIFSRLIRRDRLEQLRKMAHFRDPENEDLMDSLRKLRFFLEYVIARYKENYIPEEHLAIDEYLSL